MSATVAALVIAVKPQTAPDALPLLAALVDGKTVVVSIMAGRTLGFLEKHLPGAAIVRAMPNTPAAIGRGITVAVGNAKVKPVARKLAHGLLAATGAVEWVNDEALMDAVTAVSGSGPAYVFLLAEAMAAGRASPRACPPRWPTSSPARPWPAQANCCIARRTPPRPCARTSPRPAAPPPRRSMC